jgi:hypothetical protein
MPMLNVSEDIGYVSKLIALERQGPGPSKGSFKI